MVTSVEEVLKITKLLRRFAETFRKQAIPFDSNLPIGIMVETPAAALLAHKFAPMVQFVSIGSNDLTQYTMAARALWRLCNHTNWKSLSAVSLPVIL